MALKVFLVEDESVIREGLRDNIPWQQYGFELVGEAADGEMALPLIRKEKPDIVITDIKMPFMDGLTLTHLLKQEMPDTRVIIISGYDDFEYAQQAIKEGVEQYLLKPITRSMLQKALSEVREKILQQDEQKQYIKRFQDEMQEYEQTYRRNFFEKVFEGQTPLVELYEEAKKHSLNIDSPYYNLILMCVQEKKEISDSPEICQTCREELMRYFLKYADRCIIFRWSINIYGILVKGDEQQIQSRTLTYVNQINDTCAKYEGQLEWYVAAGTSVERFSLLGECYKNVNQAFSYRFFSANNHILQNDDSMLPERLEVSEEDALKNIDAELVNPEFIKRFLASGRSDEITNFTQNYIKGIEGALKSRLFWDYLLLNLRFTVTGYIQSVGLSVDEFAGSLSVNDIRSLEKSSENMAIYMSDLLDKAVKYIDEKNSFQGKKALKKAITYVDEHFENENLSLNEVASVSQTSANYLSAIFSQELGMTFVEYMTKKRMDKAKELLLTPGIKSGEIGPMVGYKNPQYFSFVFKKTVGCSPREYRSQHQEEVK